MRRRLKEAFDSGRGGARERQGARGGGARAHASRPLVDVGACGARACVADGSAPVLSQSLADGCASLA
eukprot:1151232-Pleurochrysis_carterae.AAC.2